MRIAQVGSSIHGKLLTPNDVDIAIVLRNRCCNKRPGMKSVKIGKLNLIFLWDISIEDYVKGMDMNIVHGYKSIFFRKLVLYYAAERALEEKKIIQFHRNELHATLFTRYDEKELDRDLKRAIKYKSKCPKGFTFEPRSDLVRKHLI